MGKGRKSSAFSLFFFGDLIECDLYTKSNRIGISMSRFARSVNAGFASPRMRMGAIFIEQSLSTCGKSGGR